MLPISMDTLSILVSSMLIVYIYIGMVFQIKITVAKIMFLSIINMLLTNMERVSMLVGSMLNMYISK